MSTEPGHGAALSPTGAPRQTEAPTLGTERLSVVYLTEQGPIRAVRDVSLNVPAGQTIGLVGESGSGKTTLALGAIGYLPANGRVESGMSHLAGIDLAGRTRRQLRHVWGSKIGLVSQNPQAALNPTLTIGQQLDEMGRRHLDLGRRGARAASLAMLERVAMPDSRAVVSRYPHQLSGGMLQRCAIAMALLTHPDLLIMDEPTTGLDVTTQATILDLLEDLKAEFRTAILYITHNLGVVSRICDRIAVMYAGEIFEEASAIDLFARPLHPYTANLLHCVPRLGGTSPRGRLATIPGSLPQLDDLPSGCVFSPRCPLATEDCRAARPPLIQADGDRRTACRRWRVLQSDEGRLAALQLDPGARGADRPARGVLPRPAATASAALLSVDDVAKDFAGGRSTVKAVDGATLSLIPLQTFGLVGESGSGKTTLARIVAGLTVPSRGRVYLDGAPLAAQVGSRDPSVLRRLQMVFQNPETSLNPRHTVGRALARPLMLLAGLERRQAALRAGELLEAVRLPASYVDRYPGELSGGEKQRVAIARAFAAGPGLVICDEPISSLDVSVQGALLNLLADLQDEAGTSYVFISHDLAAVQHLSHRIGVMYLGTLMEQGEAARVLAPPYHPYTEALLSAVPVADPTVRDTRVRLRGNPPASAVVPSGCRFHPRCPRYLGDLCRDQGPPWRLSEGKVIARDAAADAVAAAAQHAICCHVPLQELAARQELAVAQGES
jgi:peptide/nickel transport system ATP-binding protein